MARGHRPNAPEQEGRAVLMLVLDTSALSAVMHAQTFAIRRLGSERPADVYLVAPVAAEVRFGLERLPRTARRRRLLEGEYERLRRVLAWQDWTEDAADEFGRQKARLERSGRIVEDFDIAIGSIALVMGARLATLNAAHMSRIVGLRVEDWAIGSRGAR
ncbi:MAG: type II toxin-antitoxin system VapC family toxin [Deltaproteobacteria bacterium]|nr:type II toxin-antitoxin system VapC family toxin [Deltaproteobacteria bacterium]